MSCQSSLPVIQANDGANFYDQTQIQIHIENLLTSILYTFIMYYIKIPRPSFHK